MSYARVHVSDEDIGSGSAGSLSSYLAGLPQGLQSYPGHLIKAAFSRALLDEIPEAPQNLPEPIAALVDNRPMISAWIPEVHHQALLLGVAEQVFGGDDEAFLDAMLGMQRRLLKRKIYAPLLQIVDPARLLKHAARRWTNFHRGATLQLNDLTKNEARISVEHPKGLFSPVGCRALAGGFRASIEAGDTHEAEVTVVEAGDERTVFLGRWS